MLILTNLNIARKVNFRQITEIKAQLEVNQDLFNPHSSLVLELMDRKKINNK